MSAPDAGVERQLRGSTALFAGRIVSLALSLVTQVLLVRALSKADFGAFTYALALATSARTIVSFGEDQALTRFLSIYEEERAWDRLFGTLVMAVGKILVASGVLVAAVLVFREHLRGSLVDDPDAIALLGVMIFLAPVDALDRLLEGTFAVFSRPQVIFVRKYVVEPGLRLAAVLLLLLLDETVGFFAVAYVVAAAIGLVVYALALRGVLRTRGLASHFDRRRLSLPFRDYFGFSLPLVTTEVVNLSLTTFTVVVLGRVADTSEVAAFRAILPAARLNQLVIFTFTMLYTPQAARLFVRNDVDGIRHAYWQTATWLAVLSFPVFALTGPFAEPVTTTLFGDRYSSSAAPLAVLAVGYYVSAALGFNALTLQTFRRIRWVAAVNVLATIVSVASSLLLIPAHGALGAAVAVAVTVVLQNLANQAGLRTVGIPVLDRERWRVYATLVAAAGALWLVAAVFEPPFVVAVVVAGVASVGVLAATRRALALASTFPELERVPAIRRFLR